MKKTNKCKITFGQVILGIAVLALALGMVINQLSLNEISAKLNSATTQYERLVSQGEELEQQISEQVNISNIDDLATQLNMVKVKNYQIQYVDVTEADSMSATLANDEQKDGLVDTIIYSFNILVEYLK